MGCFGYEHDVCGQKHCDGEGYINCRIRNKGVVVDRLQGEYKKVRLRNPQVTRTVCFSFLEESLMPKSLPRVLNKSP